MAKDSKASKGWAMVSSSDTGIAGTPARVKIIEQSSVILVDGFLFEGRTEVVVTITATSPTDYSWTATNGLNGADTFTGQFQSLFVGCSVLISGTTHSIGDLWQFSLLPQVSLWLASDGNLQITWSDGIREYPPILDPLVLDQINAVSGPNVSYSGTLTVGGLATLSTLATSGLATLASLIVSGLSTLDSVVVSGLATLGSLVVSGVTTLASLTATTAQIDDFGYYSKRIGLTSGTRVLNVNESGSMLHNEGSTGTVEFILPANNIKPCWFLVFGTNGQTLKLSLPSGSSAVIKINNTTASSYIQSNQQNSSVRISLISPGGDWYVTSVQRTWTNV